MDTLEVVVPRDIEQWLRKRVADGAHTSLGSVVEELVAEHQFSELAIANDDHLWAKPAIDEGLASLARGEGSSLDDVATRLAQRSARTTP